jgi:hypothetical protein
MQTKLPINRTFCRVRELMPVLSWIACQGPKDTQCEMMAKKIFIYIFQASIFLERTWMADQVIFA